MSSGLSREALNLLSDMVFIQRRIDEQMDYLNELKKRDVGPERRLELGKSAHQRLEYFIDLSDHLANQYRK